MIKFRFEKVVAVLIVLVSTILVSCQKETNLNLEDSKSDEGALVSTKSSQEFLLNIIQNEKYLSQVAAIGSERATNDELKKFALETKVKHNANFEKFKLVYESNGLSVPEKLPENFREKLYKLTVTNASDFDKYFQNNVSKEYKAKLDSVSLLINENTYKDFQEVLLTVSNGYNKNIDSLEEIQL